MKNQDNPKIAVIGLKGLPAFGGAASVGENVINELKYKYNFTVYSIDTYTHLKSGFYNGFYQITFKGGSPSALNTLLYYIKSLVHVLFVKKYNLIYLHHAESGFITPFLRLKYRVIVTFHGIYRHNYIDPKFSNLTNQFFKISQFLNLKFSNKVISVSKPDSNYCKKKYNENLIVIPNGINIQNSMSSPKVTNNNLVFAAARIYDIKGLHLILQAMDMINDKRQLIVIGDLDQVSNYKQKIHNLSKNINVTFLGMIKDKKQLFEKIRGSYQFLFPSLTEAMSMMLLEVVSLKVPVLASDIPANKEIFNENEISLFKSNNVKSLAESLLSTSTSQDELNIKAERAYKRAKENYTWKNIGKQYDKIFQQIIN